MQVDGLRENRQAWPLLLVLILCICSVKCRCFVFDSFFLFVLSYICNIQLKRGAVSETLYVFIITSALSCYCSRDKI